MRANAPALALGVHDSRGGAGHVGCSLVRSPERVHGEGAKVRGMLSLQGRDSLGVVSEVVGCVNADVLSAL